ncbi:hypothetical protein OB905_13175 [Halobacteria archaeon AArc-dxtr1]|nr:hypothetical protein [Halobacteria archaeon AArc-dxtr1]
MSDPPAEFDRSVAREQRRESAIERRRQEEQEERLREEIAAAEGVDPAHVEVEQRNGEIIPRLTDEGEQTLIDQERERSRQELREEVADDLGLEVSQVAVEREDEQFVAEPTEEGEQTLRDAEVDRARSELRDDVADDLGLDPDHVRVIETDDGLTAEPTSQGEQILVDEAETEIREEIADETGVDPDDDIIIEDGEARLTDEIQQQREQEQREEFVSSLDDEITDLIDPDPDEDVVIDDGQIQLADGAEQQLQDATEQRQREEFVSDLRTDVPAGTRLDADEDVVVEDDEIRLSSDAQDRIRDLQIEEHREEAADDIGIDPDELRVIDDGDEISLEPTSDGEERLGRERLFDQRSELADELGIREQMIDVEMDGDVDDWGLDMDPSVAGHVDDPADLPGIEDERDEFADELGIEVEDLNITTEDGEVAFEPVGDGREQLAREGLFDQRSELADELGIREQMIDVEMDGDVDDWGLDMDPSVAGHVDDPADLPGVGSAREGLADDLGVSEDQIDIDAVGGEISLDPTDEAIEDVTRRELDTQRYDVARDLGIDHRALEIDTEGDVEDWGFDVDPGRVSDPLDVPGVEDAREDFAEELGVSEDEIDIETVDDEITLGPTEAAEEQLILDEVAGELGVSPDDLVLTDVDPQDVDEVEEMRRHFADEVGLWPDAIDVSQQNGEIGFSVADRFDGFEDATETMDFEGELTGVQLADDADPFAIDAVEDQRQDVADELGIDEHLVSADIEDGAVEFDLRPRGEALVERQHLDEQREEFASEIGVEPGDVVREDDQFTISEDAQLGQVEQQVSEDLGISADDLEATFRDEEVVAEERFRRSRMGLDADDVQEVDIDIDPDVESELLRDDAAETLGIDPGEVEGVDPSTGELELSRGAQEDLLLEQIQDEDPGVDPDDVSFVEDDGELVAEVEGPSTFDMAVDRFVSIGREEHTPQDIASGIADGVVDIGSNIRESVSGAAETVVDVGQEAHSPQDIVSDAVDTVPIDERAAIAGGGLLAAPDPVTDIGGAAILTGGALAGGAVLAHERLTETEIDEIEQETPGLTGAEIDIPEDSVEWDVTEIEAPEGRVEWDATEFEAPGERVEWDTTELDIPEDRLEWHQEEVGVPEDVIDERAEVGIPTIEAAEFAGLDRQFEEDIEPVSEGVSAGVITADDLVDPDEMHQGVERELEDQQFDQADFELDRIQETLSDDALAEQEVFEDVTGELTQGGTFRDVPGQAIWDDSETLSRVAGEQLAEEPTPDAIEDTLELIEQTRPEVFDDATTEAPQGVSESIVQQPTDAVDHVGGIAVGPGLGSGPRAPVLPDQPAFEEQILDRGAVPPLVDDAVRLGPGEEIVHEQPSAIPETPRERVDSHLREGLHERLADDVVQQPQGRIDVDVPPMEQQQPDVGAPMAPELRTGVAPSDEFVSPLSPTQVEADTEVANPQEHQVAFETPFVTPQVHQTGRQGRPPLRVPMPDLDAEDGAEGEVPGWQQGDYFNPFAGPGEILGIGAPGQSPMQGLFGGGGQRG